ncbi:TPA: hypothetical protein EYP66_04130 [Candidatus Poribacteria bacterium]|nr:hypothetical protein [Candidatus Poribacteria bacterium]
MAQQESSREVQEIWELFRGVTKLQEETARRQEENAREIKQLHDTVDALTGNGETVKILNDEKFKPKLW